MAIFMKNPLSADQVEQIMVESGCSKGEAVSKAKTAVKNGMDVDYFMKQQLWKMSKPELSNYLQKSTARKYVEALSGRKGVTDFEIYRQMVRARSEYGITFASFAKKKLVNASDERLERVQGKAQDKQAKTVSMIADSMGISEEEAQQIIDRIKGEFGFNSREIYINRFYLMTDDEIAEWKSKNSGHKKEIISRIQDETGWAPSQVRSHMSQCQIDFGIDPATYYSQKCHLLEDWQLALSGNMSDSKKLSAKYNKGHANVLYDKQLFNKTYKDYIGRKFWMNRDTDFSEFAEFADGLKELFCKPIDSSIGRGTYKYDIEGKDLNEVYDYFMNQPKYLIEECVSQHPKMAEFYPDSLNTIRLFTILDHGEFDAFLSFVRFGVEGFIDNFSSGGIACAVDPKTGILTTDAVNKDGAVFPTHPISGIAFKGFQIPHWDQVLERSEAALRAVDGVNYVGWDIAIQDDGIVFIEGNSSPDLGVQQALDITERRFIRPTYYKYLRPLAYDDMLFKVADAMKRFHCTEAQAANRLEEAARCGYDYDFVEKQQLCRLTVRQIKRYASREDVRDAVNQVAEENDATIAEAFLQMRHAEKDFNIPFSDFKNEKLFGLGDEKLAQYALD